MNKIADGRILIFQNNIHMFTIIKIFLYKNTYLFSKYFILFLFTEISFNTRSVPHRTEHPVLPSVTVANYVTDFLSHLALTYVTFNMCTRIHQQLIRPI